MAWSPRGSFFIGFISGFVAALLVVLASLFGAAFFLRDYLVERRADKLDAPPMVPGMQAEYAWNVIDADGKTRSFTEFQGKPVFLQFWSPSCTACEAEIPSVNALYEKTRDSGVEFVAITADTKSDEIYETAQRLNIQYPVYTVEGPVPSVYQFTAGPATFIIDHKGYLVFKHIGASKWDSTVVVSFLQALGITAKMPAPEIEVPEMFNPPEAVPPDGQ